MTRTIFLSACTVFLILHTRSLPGEETAFREWSDETFASHATGDLQLDVIRPDDEERRPAVLCLHGGFWVKGSKENIHSLAIDLAKRGYVGISSNYRLTGVAPYPAQLEDTRLAIRYLRENADRFGIDPDQIGVVGSSAGGFLAVLAATEGNCEPIERPNAAVGMGAQSDLTSPHLQNVATGRSAENWTKFMGGIYREVPENYAAASPLQHLSGDDVPVAFVSGEFDHESTRANRFRQAAFRLGIPTGLTIIPKGPHGLIRNDGFRHAAADAIDGFFGFYLRSGNTGRVPLIVESDIDPGIELLSDEWTRLGGGYSGCEGAQWLKPYEGREATLVFAAHHDHLLFRWSEKAGLRLWQEGTAEMSTLRPIPGGFVAVEQQTRRLVRVAGDTSAIEVLAERLDGKRFNRPNDLRVRPGRGTVWFTDPNYLFRTRPVETQELPGQYVFRYNPADGSLTAPIRDLQIPNGIAFNGKGNRLFIGDSRAREIRNYSVTDDGTVKAEPEPVARFPEGLDGISLAPDGRLWVAQPGRVTIITQQGQVIGYLPMPGRCTSIDFVAEAGFHRVAITTREAAHVAKIRFSHVR